jgi:ankyrin repeat protein
LIIEGPKMINKLSFTLIMSIFIMHNSFAMRTKEQEVKKQKIDQKVDVDLEHAKARLQKSLHDSNINSMREILEQFTEDNQRWLVNQKMQTHNYSNLCEPFLALVYEKGSTADYVYGRISQWLPFIEDILKKGADLNVRSHKKQTVLAKAIINGYFNYVNLFLKYGSDPSQAVFFGKNKQQLPLDYVASKKKEIDRKMKFLKVNRDTYKSYQRQLEDFQQIEKALQKAIEEYPTLVRRKLLQELKQTLKQKEGVRILQRIAQHQNEQSIDFLRKLRREQEK